MTIDVLVGIATTHIKRQLMSDLFIGYKYLNHTSKSKQLAAKRNSKVYLELVRILWVPGHFIQCNLNLSISIAHNFHPFAFFNRPQFRPI